MIGKLVARVKLKQAERSKRKSEEKDLFDKVFREERKRAVTEAAKERAASIKMRAKEKARQPSFSKRVGKGIVKAATSKPVKNFVFGKKKKKKKTPTRTVYVVRPKRMIRRQSYKGPVQKKESGGFGLSDFL